MPTRCPACLIQFKNGLGEKVLVKPIAGVIQAHANVPQGHNPKVFIPPRNVNEIQRLNGMFRSMREERW